MKNQKIKKKINPQSKEHDTERREFIIKSAKEIGVCGFAIYELARTIKEDIVQEVVDNVKKTVDDLKNDIKKSV
ncbi:MAG: hypothetical protein QG641_124 [Candidatus Poribacteria bacterium]|nr:hypothetical protein [Candidatus Poribacteria bacterium]